MHYEKITCRQTFREKDYGGNGQFSNKEVVMDLEQLLRER